MRSLHKIWRMPVRQKLMAAEAVVLLAFACIALRFIPYRALMARLPGGDHPAPPETARAIASAMRRASLLFGDDLCLRQAVAGHVMLARRGAGAAIRIGMRLGDDDLPAAHAWLVSGNFVVTGGTADSLRGFTPFSPRSMPAGPPAS